MNKKRQLAKNSLILSIGKLSAQLISFFLLPIYTFFLTPHELGFIDLSLTYITLLAPAATLQIEMAAFRLLIDARNDDQRKKVIISSILQIMLASIVVLTLIYVTITRFIKIDYSFLILLNIFAAILTNIFLQFARGLGRNKDFAISSFLLSLVMLILIIILIVTAHAGLPGVLVSTIIANVASVIYLSIRLKLYRYINLKEVNKPTIKSILKYSLPLIPNGLSWWVINVSDRTIIAAFIGLSANGVYTVANKFAAILSGLFIIFYTALTESISLHIEDSDSEKFISSVNNFSLKLFGSIGLLIIAVSHFVVSALIGQDFKSADQFIPILIIATLFNTVVGAYSTVYIAKKMTKKVANTSIVAAVINITLTLALIKFIGIYAAALATAVAFLAMAVYRHFDLKKIMNIHYENNLIAKFIFIYAFTVFIYYINNSYLNILNLIIAGIFFVVINKKSISSARIIISQKIPPKKTIIKICKYIALAIWLTVIFLFSNENSGISSSHSDIIVNIINPSSTAATKEMLTFIVRKIAHFTVYLILGILIFNIMRDYKKLTSRKQIILSLLLAAGYATTDEFHQLFISGRSGQLRDIMIDSAGSLTGILILFFAIKNNWPDKLKRLINSKKIWNILNKILGLVATICILIAIASIISTNIIPNKYLSILIPVILVFGVILAAVNLKNKSNKRLFLLMPINIIAIAGAIFIHSICTNINSFIDNIQDGNSNYATYVIVVKKGSGVTLKNNNHQIGELAKDENKTETDKVIKANTSAAIKEYNELDDLISNLDTGQSNSLLLKSSYLNLLDENYKNFYDSLKVIYSFKVKIQSTASSNVNLSQPFIIYISGIDTYGDISSVSRSDVNMLAVVNPNTHKILLVNTPRDYYVQLHNATGLRDKLTHAGIYGIDMSMRTIEDLYDTKVDYYLRVNFSSLINIIDTIGDINVYSDYSFKTAHYSFKQGYNTLNSAQALEFSRERHAFNDGDRTRGKNQQRVIEAIIAKSNNSSELVKYQSILNTLGKTLQTNASRSDITTILNQQINSKKGWQVESISVTGSGKSAPTYSMGSINLYVMEPDINSVNEAKSKIQQYKK